ncbi:MAG: hypothetical protein K6F84_07465, partial [Lachnospiraceae bacterium]|nr:hypothetical protein [Lachnospiraceae bacterium]
TKEYKDALINSVLKKRYTFDFTKDNYEEFETFIFLYVFEKDCVKITEDEYPECIKTFIGRLPDREKYIISG